jgi:hypothetical protein
LGGNLGRRKMLDKVKIKVKGKVKVKGKKKDKNMCGGGDASDGGGWGVSDHRMSSVKPSLRCSTHGSRKDGL